MAKTVRFINDASVLTVPGIGKITSDNLTYKVYERLLSLNPSHAKQFIVTDEPVKKVSTKTNE